jgi:phage tail-like protein
MATQRTNGAPYGAFNFQVSTDLIGGGSATSVQAGFQEISGLGMEVTEAEYRTGKDKVNHVRKISGLYKSSDVTFKRGICAFVDIFGWINNTRIGQEVADTNGQGRTVTINLMDETGNSAVMTWTLTGAKPKSYKGVTLNAKTGTDVAIEELVLSVENIDVS